MIFRRPELEKDNPIAPEPYVGPRRRLAMARAAAPEKSTEAGDLRETLRTLATSAAQFLREQPNVRKPGKSLMALRDAIAKADHVLTLEQ
ncbi:MAG: hypothetical protein AB7P24_20445 [Nitrospira sp.]